MHTSVAVKAHVWCCLGHTALELCMQRLQNSTRCHGRLMFLQPDVLEGAVSFLDC